MPRGPRLRREPWKADAGVPMTLRPSMDLEMKVRPLWEGIKAAQALGKELS